MTTGRALKVIILGAASGIAEATARLYASEHAELLLVARHAERLQTIAADLRLRGAARVETLVRDLAEASDAVAAVDGMVQPLGGVDHVILAYGILGDQTRAESDPDEARRILHVNFTSATMWAAAVANVLQRQGRGTLVLLGSVAGDRGRRANYVYGAAKAGLAAFAEGLAHRFAETGPRVVVVKPGPTATAMTASMAKSGPLMADVDTVARCVRRAAEGRRAVVYAPGLWRWIMLIIRNIPQRIFNRLNI